MRRTQKSDSSHLDVEFSPTENATSTWTESAFWDFLTCTIEHVSRRNEEVSCLPAVPGVWWMQKLFSCCIFIDSSHRVWLTFHQCLLRLLYNSWLCFCSCQNTEIATIFQEGNLNKEAQADKSTGIVSLFQLKVAKPKDVCFASVNEILIRLAGVKLMK